MPLVPEDDPAALAELLGYLGEIGYGELYLKSRPGAPAAGLPAGPAEGGPGAPALADLAAAAHDAVRGASGEGGGDGDGDEGSDGGDGGDRSAAGGRDDGSATDGRGDADADATARSLAAIAETVAACRRCRLCEGRQKTVFGAGNPHADLMFIGEGPGAEEDRQGLPFVGRAGELLTRIIEAIGMTREQVYIANIVKCRPPGNRDPQPDEVSACRPYLERQIALVKPRLMVALGRIAAQTLLANDLPIGRMRGQWFTVLGVPTMVTYHPAALLRNPALKRPTWEDMQQVRDRLNEAAP
jgi:uracil-DNA glycosylase family 4